jgi:LysM repeat protein
MRQQDIQSTNKNEIDLLEILRFIYRKTKVFFRCIATVLGATAIYLLRNSLWIVLFAALGVAASIIMDKRTPKVYRAEAIIRSNNLAITIVADNIGKLNNLCTLRNYRELSRLLNISELDAEKIHSLSTRYGLITYKEQLHVSEQPMYYAKKYKWNDTTLRVSKFVKIIVEVSDENVYATLTPGLLHFIGNNSFGQMVNTLRVEQLKSQIAYTEHEISTLQQIQATYISKGSNASVQLELNGALQKSEQVQLHETINRLYQLKIEFEREYTLFTQPATIVSDFSKTYRPTVGLLKRSVVTSSAAVLLGLVALLLWDTRKKMRRRRQRNVRT